MRLEKSWYTRTFLPRAILSVVLDNCEPVAATETSVKPVGLQQPRLKLPASFMLAHSLNLVSYLSSHGSFKSVLIDMFREKYSPRLQIT